MKKLMLVYAFLFLACGVGSALAQNSANAAVVINHGTGLCGMLGSDASGNAIFGGDGTVVQELQNDNKVTIMCKGTGITNLSGTGQSYSGFLCGVVSPDGNFYITSDSQTTIAPNGNATLRCTVDL